MNKIKKIVVVICLVCFLPFSVSSKNVYANASDGALSYPYIVQGVSSIATALGSISPVPILVVGIIGVSLGIIFENKDEIIAFTGEVVNKCRELGKNLLDLFTVDKSGVTHVTGELINIVNSTVEGYKLNHSDLTSVGEILNIDLSNFNYDVASSPSGFLSKTNLFTISLETGHSYNFKITLTRGKGYAFNSSYIFGGETLTNNLSLIPSKYDSFLEKTLYYSINTSVSPFTYSSATTLDGLNAFYNTYKMGNSLVNTDFSLSINTVNPTLTDYKDSLFIDTNISVENILDTSSIGALDNYTGEFVDEKLKTGDIAISIPIDKPLTYDTVIDKTYSDLISGDITLENTSSTDIPGTNAPGVGNLSVELDLSPLYIDLSKKFPFCIPFDIVNMIKDFSSVKKRPVVSVSLPEKYFGSNTIDVDLAFYDDYFPFSTILRYFLLISFIYFLIKNTRNLIGG